MGVMLVVDDDDCILTRDLSVSAFVAIDYERGGYIKPDRPVPAVKPCTWDDLSA